MFESKVGNVLCNGQISSKAKIYTKCEQTVKAVKFK